MRRRLLVFALALLCAFPAPALPPFTFAVMSVIRPGDGNALQATQSGPVWTVGPEGRIFRDGLGTAGYAKQVLQFGDDIYAQGKTIPSWWRWDGLKWVAVGVMSWDALATIAASAPAPSVSGQIQPMITPKAAGKIGTPK